ncbi:MAG: Glu-tRNA(Gln) amidotransferase subunit GatE [archaeon]|nr:Glu-tRNA(Gln) amidotransferase subunit GatE [archaeon]
MQIDYQKLGLIAGIEVHQQLDTGKLFCRCPTILREDSPNIIITRKLRPVASELGEFDKAALEQFKKNLSYVYEAYSDTTCEIELDEEPIQSMEKDSLNTALEVGLMLETKILNEAIVMRKTVIDGSNTSGFQRTSLIGVGGSISIGEKQIGIQSIVLEEDAARTISKTETQIVYRLDRLGFPLIEIATAPDINSPIEAKQTAKAIGELLRRTGKIKRGLGTIRQDINISIREGARVEIKGVQELELIDEFVQREAERQLNLLEIKKELEKRNISIEQIDETKAIELNAFSNPVQFLKNKKIAGIKLSGFNRLIGKEIQLNRRLGTEIADYVRVQTGLKGIIHSDESLEKYQFTKTEIENIRKKLSMQENDAFVLIAHEDLRKAKQILEEIVLQRAKYCLKGVPEETRNALMDGNSEYSRPLAGEARMYPETDIGSIKISKEMLTEIKKSLPLTPEQRIEFYKKQGLSQQLAEKMKLSNYARFFEELLRKGFNANNSAALLLEGLIQLKRENIDIEQFSDTQLEEILSSTEKGKITKEIQLDVLRNWAKNSTASLQEIISSMNVSMLSEKEVKEIVQKIVANNSSIIKDKGEHSLSTLMGMLMKEIKGKADGKKAAELLKEEMKKEM